MKFSANLGFLWTDRPLPDAIRAAKAAGFDAVECHWPYSVPAAATKAALEETGLELLGLNTSRGDTAIGENGLSALPGREEDATDWFARAAAADRDGETDAAERYAELAGLEIIDTEDDDPFTDASPELAPTEPAATESDVAEGDSTESGPAEDA